MKPRLLALALTLATALHAFAAVNETQAPGALFSTASSRATPSKLAALPTAVSQGRLPTAPPDHLMTAFVASTPLARLEVAPLPRRQTKPTPAPAPGPTPTSVPTPDPNRAGCDPACPDERTCVPPGPPFAQGCAITAERRFTVLPPDPQRLDHDKDGIGCEPIR